MTVLLCRILWSLLGPMLLMFAAATIVQSGSGWFTADDLLFAVILLGTILCRWADFRYGERTDSYGQPVTVSDLRRYTRIWAMAGVAIWAGANLIGRYLV